MSMGAVACFEHVHPDEWSVFDFSFWTLAHPGNYDAITADTPATSLPAAITRLSSSCPAS